jgi:hydrogenase maturation protease
MTDPKTIVIGLGNPILGDDGAGWKVAEFLRDRLPPGIEVDFLAGGGLSVMERLVGFDRAVIVDALNTATVAKGQVQVFALESLSNPFLGHLGSAHETNLQTALNLGRSLGAHLPTCVMVVGVESPDVYDFDDALSPEIEAAVPPAAQAVLDLIHQFDTSP